MTRPELARRLIPLADALEAGDLAYARTLLHDLLNEAERRWRTVRPTCPGCGQDFDYPGLRDRHQAVTGCANAQEAA